jgi:excisionase family DNA binding protein
MKTKMKQSLVEQAIINRIDTEPWTSVADVARHLGIKRDTIYKWLERKDLPAHKVGRLRKFKISEVDVWVKTGGASRK